MVPTKPTAVMFVPRKFSERELLLYISNRTMASMALASAPM